MTVVTATQFAPATLHELCASSTSATWPTTPSMLEAMATMPPSRPPTRVYTAGARTVPSVLERFIGSWKVIPGDLYGASEVGTIAFTRDAREPLMLVSGVDVRIEDGEVCVRSDAMLARYLPRDESALREGFFATGDLGHFEGKGLRIDGRLKLQFDVGGLKVNPIEVELHLLAHPAVREAVVVPQRMTESVLRAHAIIVPRDGAIDVDDVRRTLRERLPAHMIPRTFELREELPRTATGKVDRRALVECAS
jgi:acyl-CoA synthetase (AMP-forming)/AMP-acid ligase II